MARKIAPPLKVTATFDGQIREGKTTRVTGNVTRGDQPVECAKVRVTWIRSGATTALGATCTNIKGRFARDVNPPRSGTLRIIASSWGQKACLSKPIVVIR
jgi:hypothetical protein